MRTTRGSKFWILTCFFFIFCVSVILIEAATATSGTESKFSSNTTYNYTVRAEDGSRYFFVAGDTLTVASPAPLPAITSFQVNNGASRTTSRAITLNNTATNSPTHYMSSESSNFRGASWLTYSASPSFTLSSGNGIKTVYFKVKNSAGESFIVNNTITLTSILPLTFANEGINYIYSNQPEEAKDTDKYTIEKVLEANIGYDIEFYHFNYSGTTAKFGVALYNPHQSEAIISIDANVSGWSKVDPDNPTIELTARQQVDYQKGKGGATTMSIKPGDCCFLIAEDAPNKSFVSGKAKIRSSLSGIKLRVFFGHPTSPKEVFLESYHRAEVAKDGNGKTTHQTTCFFKYDGKRCITTIDASTYPTFYLSEWSPQYNQNEYEIGSDILGGSNNSKLKDFLGGNYGMVYTITIKNPKGKKLKITPCWGSKNRRAKIVLYPYDGGWKSTFMNIIKDTPNQKDLHWIMPMPDTDTFTFKYVLPGGNCGTMKFEVITRLLQRLR